MSFPAGGEFWLLKVPNFVHEAWNATRKANEEAAKSQQEKAAAAAAAKGDGSAPASSASSKRAAMHLGQPVAHIWVEKNPRDGQQRRMKIVAPVRAGPLGSPVAGGGAASSPSMSPPSPASSASPSLAGSGAMTTTELGFTLKPRTQPMLVFGTSVPPSAAQKEAAQKAASSVAAQGRNLAPPEAFRLEGEVSLQADCLPRQTAAYQSLVANRLANHLAAQRTTKMTQEGEVAVTPMNAGMVPLKRKADSWLAAARAAKAEKRVRLEPAELEREVLHLLSQPQFQFVTISKVAMETQQPLGAVGECVKRLCVKAEEGENKGMFTLKPEYKLATDVEQQQPPPATTTRAAPMGGVSAPFAPLAPGSVASPAALAAMFAVKTEPGVKQEIKREFR